MGAGVEALPDFPLCRTGELGGRFVGGGIIGFRAAARYVQTLPYGRNSDRSDHRLVMEEGRGTCSTKHALLAELAAENAPPTLPPIELRLGLYEMHEGNTPGVGPVLRRRGLPCVPEAHCYLAYEGVRVDLTRGEVGEAEMLFLEEERIGPHGIGEYKVGWHKRLVRRWAEAHGFDAAAVWRAREECIEALAGDGGRTPKAPREHLGGVGGVADGAEGAAG